MNEQSGQQGSEAYEGWAVLEAMGHRSHGGYVRPCRMYGADMVRVDVPDVNNEGKTLYTRYYGGSSIYCLTPCSEAAARKYAAQTQYQAPTYLQLPLSTGERADGEDEDEDLPEEPSSPTQGDPREEF